MPLIALAIPTVVAGFWGIDTLLNRQFKVASDVPAPGFLGQLFAPLNHAPMAGLAGLGAVMFGFSLAWTLYREAKTDPLPEKLGKLARAMRNRFYFDEIYEALISITQEFLAFVAEFVDRWIIAGLMVRGTHGSTEIFGRALRLLQTGNLQTYAFLFVLGVAVVLWFALGKTP